MILIADSGSTKTDWVIADLKSDTKAVITTQGINPFHQTDEEINSILVSELLPKLNANHLFEGAETIAQVHFYGAGCVESVQPKMKNCLSFIFNSAEVSVNGDLLAAARALCGKEKGIACILGTGSNSCYYDGKNIVKNVPPLGYILGDEGSGAALGKLFMNGIFKESLPIEIQKQYLEEEKISYKDIIEKVYRKPLANRFLASTSRFIFRHIETPELQALVRENFDLFFEKNITHYNEFGIKKVSAVGSIAFHFKDYFIASAHKYGYEVEHVEKSPIMRMLDYHRSF